MAKEKAKKKKMAVPKREGPSRKKLIEQADLWASRYIRLRDAESGGLVSCYTCGKKFHISKIQCGHFIGRAHYSTRYDPRNMHAQCMQCNGYRSGEPGAYAYRLLTELGITEFTELLVVGQQSIIFGEEQLKELIVGFKELTTKALHEKHITAWW